MKKIFKCNSKILKLFYIIKNYKSPFIKRLKKILTFEIRRFNVINDRLKLEKLINEELEKRIELLKEIKDKSN